jgi:acyl phosphate:glycerol-3-phosphate acyltransferase
MLELFAKLFLGYLAGSLVGSLLVGRVRGVDIRRVGSGNAGGTNALRTQGKAFALAVVIIDVAKVVLPVLLLTGAALPGVGVDPSVSRQSIAVAIAAGAVIGHVWPIFFGFRGGKGMATLLGAYGAIQPLLLAGVVLTWVLMLLLRGYVGLATVFAAAMAPVWLGLAGQAAGPVFWFALLMAAFVAWTHRGNLARMRAGTESRMFPGLAGRRREL